MDDVVPTRLKREIADLYLRNSKKLDAVDAEALQSFASKVLEIISRMDSKLQLSHDIEVLKESMTHLKNDSLKLQKSELDSDDYDFAHNDCKNLMNSVKRWLKLEGLLS
jgi:hypothetical protein